MPTFLVESYLPRSADALAESSAHARRAAAVAAGGLSIQYVRTTIVGADETCFHVFDASSLDELEAALAGVDLVADRISEVAETTDGARGS